MIRKFSNKFGSLKNSDFFWNDINANVNTAQYAVRGLVPTTATKMKEELLTNPKSNYSCI